MLKVIVIFFGLLLALWENIAVANESNPLPTFIVENSVEVMEYDGHTLRDAHLDESPSFSGYPDDLLSGGLNTVGLQSTTPPSFADPLNPTATELRRYAFYTYFRSNIDITTEGGFGLFWGPDLAPDFGPDIEHGLIPGVEYTASMQVSERSGNIHRIPVAIQIPDHFDLKNPCIFLASSPESQGYYGGIAIGEWGLLKGCAVVLPGKGTGTGFHDLSSDKVYTADGVLTSATFSNAKIQFAVEKNGQLKEFTKKHPHRVATKHAHSQINCERIWGDLALNGIEFAFWALNDWFGQIMTTAEKVNNQSKKLDEICYPLEDEYTPENTLVIAAGISDGGGAALRALENDTKGLIDGLVVSQPNINPDSANKFEIKIGTKRFNGHGTSFFENSTLMGIYAPCAALSLSLQNTPCNVDPIGAPEGARVNRCQALYSIGLLKADTILDQAEEALDILRAHGYEQAQEILLAGYEWLNIWRSLNPAYAAALGRFAVWENIGGISFGATDKDSGIPIALNRQKAPLLFSVSSGIFPTGGINLINDNAVNGPVLENLSISSSSNLKDLNLDSALYYRYLATGDATLISDGPTLEDRRNLARVQKGIIETLTTGDLHGTPAIILSGRSDAMVFPNYHARPYYGLNQIVEKRKSRLRYIEVLNAQHFDAMISTHWLDPKTKAAQFVPLHYYLFSSLDWMYAYLNDEKVELPPSQIIRPQPRKENAYAKEDMDTDLLPDIKMFPDAKDLITFNEKVLYIPE